MDSAAITTRIKEIMEHYYLTASSFADEIGVQRSSMSHILSGRNKPSLDFVLKVTKRFPDVNMDWLLNGQGSFLDDNKSEEKSSISFPSTTAPSPPSQAQNWSGDEEMKTVEKPMDQAPLLAVQSASDKMGNTKKIRQIIVFYEDGTFDEFSPS